MPALLSLLVLGVFVAPTVISTATTSRAVSEGYPFRYPSGGPRPLRFGDRIPTSTESPEYTETYQTSTSFPEQTGTYGTTQYQQPTSGGGGYQEELRNYQRHDRDYPHEAANNCSEPYGRCGEQQQSEDYQLPAESTPRDLDHEINDVTGHDHQLTRNPFHQASYPPVTTLVPSTPLPNYTPPDDSLIRYTAPVTKPSKEFLPPHLDTTLNQDFNTQSPVEKVVSQDIHLAAQQSSRPSFSRPSPNYLPATFSGPSFPSNPFPVQQQKHEGTTPAAQEEYNQVQSQQKPTAPASEYLPPFEQPEQYTTQQPSVAPEYLPPFTTYRPTTSQQESHKPINAIPSPTVKPEYLPPFRKLRPSTSGYNNSDAPGHFVTQLPQSTPQPNYLPPYQNQQPFVNPNPKVDSHSSRQPPPEAHPEPFDGRPHYDQTGASPQHFGGTGSTFPPQTQSSGRPTNTSPSTIGKEYLPPVSDYQKPNKAPQSITIPISSPGPQYLPPVDDFAGNRQQQPQYHQQQQPQQQQPQPQSPNYLPPYEEPTRPHTSSTASPVPSQSNRYLPPHNLQQFNQNLPAAEHTPGPKYLPPHTSQQQTFNQNLPSEPEKHTPGPKYLPPMKSTPVVPTGQQQSVGSTQQQQNVASHQQHYQQPVGPVQQQSVGPSYQQQNVGPSHHEQSVGPSQQQPSSEYVPPNANPTPDSVHVHPSVPCWPPTPKPSYLPPVDTVFDSLSAQSLRPARVSTPAPDQEYLSPNALLSRTGLLSDDKPELVTEGPARELVPPYTSNLEESPVEIPVEDLDLTEEDLSPLLERLEKTLEVNPKEITEDDGYPRYQPPISIEGPQNKPLEYKQPIKVEGTTQPPKEEKPEERSTQPPIVMDEGVARKINSFLRSPAISNHIASKPYSSATPPPAPTRPYYQPPPPPPNPYYQQGGNSLAPWSYTPQPYTTQPYWQPVQQPQYRQYDSFPSATFNYNPCPYGQCGYPAPYHQYHPPPHAAPPPYQYNAYQNGGPNQNRFNNVQQGHTSQQDYSKRAVDSATYALSHLAQIGPNRS